jgi:hypothetical protein
MQELSILEASPFHGYLQDLAACLTAGARCGATLRRIDLCVGQRDRVHVPRLTRALAALPELEHVRLVPQVFGIGTGAGRCPAVEAGRAGLAGLPGRFAELVERLQQV